MNRSEIKQHNQAIMALVTDWLKARYSSRGHYCQLRLRPPRMGYKELAIKLNVAEVRTSRGNQWTFRSLYRMMQRQKVRLIDISRSR